jgi:hypothetical protein
LGYLGADPYICGYTHPGSDKKALLLEFSTGATFDRKYWNRTGIHEAKDIYYSEGTFYLVGRYKEEDASVPAGFLMLVNDSTWNMNSMHYTNHTLGVEFRKLAYFADGPGVFICGDMDDAAGSITDTYNDPAADAPDEDWQVAAGTTTSITIGTEATNGANVIDITTAIIDTGGGGKDAAMVLLELN